MSSVQNFVPAEMLPSGYLIRPCEGGGSIIHIVDHINLEVYLGHTIFIDTLLVTFSLYSIFLPPAK